MDIYDEVEKFYRNFSGEKCVIGTSVMGRKIFAMRIGKATDRPYMGVYAVHAREWICARLALKHLRLRTKYAYWAIPLLNPDGAIIAAKNHLWKANARGVDLNCNFPAKWGAGLKNTLTPGGENYIGLHPLSEPETQAIAAFTLKIKPCCTLSFHTKGGEIYWEFGGQGNYFGAKLISDLTGYEAKIIHGSAGGYKDWCIEKLHIPAYTVECGKDSLCHPVKSLKKIEECKYIARYFCGNFNARTPD